MIRNQYCFLQNKVYSICVLIFKCIQKYLFNVSVFWIFRFITAANIHHPVRTSRQVSESNQQSFDFFYVRQSTFDHQQWIRQGIEGVLRFLILQFFIADFVFPYSYLQFFSIHFISTLHQSLFFFSFSLFFNVCLLFCTCCHVYFFL